MIDNIMNTYNDYFDILDKQILYNELFINENNYKNLNKNYIKQQIDIEHKINKDKQNDVKININDVNINDETENENKIKYIRNIYKKSALKTHPDSSKTDSEQFTKIKDAYNNSNISLLLYYASKNKLNFNIPKEYEKQILKELNNVKVKIQDIKSSVCWKWFHYSNDERINFLKQIKDYFG